MKILVVDDDQELLNIVSLTLKHADYQVETARDGEAALREWQRVQPHLIVLDLNLPGKSGLQVLEHVRAVSTVPVIILTVQNDEEDIVRAFEIGADDYVTKPFSPRQLVARTKAALRRAGVEQRAEIILGELWLDLTQHQVTRVGGQPIHLSPLESRLLEVMMSAPNEPFTTEKLIERVWGYEGRLADNKLLKSLIRRVRTKIEAEPGEPRYLRTVPGVGYVFSIGR